MKKEFWKLLRINTRLQKMKACTIAKDFREALEPAKEFEYEDLPALELNF